MAQDPRDVGGLTGWVLSVIELAGEAGVGFLVLLENLFPPIPSELVLPLAGLLAAQGRLSYLLTVLAATSGSVLGALVLYEAGRHLGRKRILRLLEALPLLDASDLTDSEEWFQRHGRASVLFGRCIPGVRSFISIPAGIAQMPRVSFLLLTSLGSLVWNVVFITLGYTIASGTEDIEDIAQVVDLVLYVIIALFLLLLLRRIYRRIRRPA